MLIAFHRGLVLILLGLFMLFSAGSAWAQEQGYSPPEEEKVRKAPIREDTTDFIADWLEDSADFCELLPREVRVHCLADQISKLVASMPEGGEYAEARAALKDLSDELTAIARKHADPSVKRTRYRAKRSDGSGFITSAPLIATTPEASKAVADEAINAIAETQTILLRSSENSRRRAAAFQKVSSALDSSKVLLRSA